MENLNVSEQIDVEDYSPRMPKIIEMASSLCSMKVVEDLQRAGAEYVMVKKAPFQVVGRRCITKHGGGAWEVARNDGSIKKLEQMETGAPFLGLCFGFMEDGSNDNMVGMEYDTKLEGMEYFEYPAHEWLIYTLSGKISEDVLGNGWWYVNNRLLNELGLVKDDLPTIESYVEWNNEEDRCSIEICIPYRRKSMK